MVGIQIMTFFIKHLLFNRPVTGELRQNQQLNKSPRIILVKHL